MSEAVNKTFVATYIGPADKPLTGAFCGKCALEQYPGNIGVFKYYRDIDSFLLFEQPIDSLNLIEGKDYVIRNKGFLPLDTSKCLIAQCSSLAQGVECKGKLCYQEIVENCV